MLTFVINWNKIKIGPRKRGDMEELYYFDERSTAIKFVGISSVCEETKNPLVDDEIHNKYDKWYKYLFSDKKNFIDFVKTFMKVQLNVELTENNITLMDKEFITKEFGKQESDIIYEVNPADNTLSTSKLGIFEEVGYRKETENSYKITLISNTGVNDFNSAYYYAK